MKFFDQTADKHLNVQDPAIIVDNIKSALTEATSDNLIIILDSTTDQTRPHLLLFILSQLRNNATSTEGIKLSYRHLRNLLQLYSCTVIGKDNYIWLKGVIGEDTKNYCMIAWRDMFFFEVVMNIMTFVKGDFLHTQYKEHGCKILIPNGFSSPEDFFIQSSIQNRTISLIMQIASLNSTEDDKKGPLCLITYTAILEKVIKSDNTQLFHNCVEEIEKNIKDYESFLRTHMRREFGSLFGNSSSDNIVNDTHKSFIEKFFKYYTVIITNSIQHHRLEIFLYIVNRFWKNKNPKYLDSEYNEGAVTYTGYAILQLCKCGNLDFLHEVLLLDSRKDAQTQQKAYSNSSILSYSIPVIDQAESSSLSSSIPVIDQATSSSLSSSIPVIDQAASSSLNSLATTRNQEEASISSRSNSEKSDKIDFSGKSTQNTILFTLQKLCKYASYKNINEFVEKYAQDFDKETEDDCLIQNTVCYLIEYERWPNKNIESLSFASPMDHTSDIIFADKCWPSLPLKDLEKIYPDKDFQNHSLELHELSQKLTIYHFAVMQKFKLGHKLSRTDLELFSEITQVVNSYAQESVYSYDITDTIPAKLFVAYIDSYYELFTKKHTTFKSLDFSIFANISCKFTPDIGKELYLTDDILSQLNEKICFMTKYACVHNTGYSEKTMEIITQIYNIITENLTVIKEDFPESKQWSHPYLVKKMEEINTLISSSYDFLQYPKTSENDGTMAYKLQQISSILQNNNYLIRNCAPTTARKLNKDGGNVNKEDGTAKRLKHS